VIGSATVLPRSGDLFAVSFTRAWKAIDATHADLTVPLRVLGARGFYSDGIFGWHGHQNATLASGTLNLFGGATPTPTPSSSQASDPCLTLESFSNEFAMPLTGSNFTVAYTVDCVASTIEFTLTTETTGWLAIGFNSMSQMSNGDVYQASVSSNGTVTVRNGYADGKHVVSNSSAQAILVGTPSGSLTNGTMSVTFKRRLNATSPDQLSLSFANPLFVLVARRLISSDFDYPHIHDDSGRKRSAAPVQLFTTGNVDNNGNDADSIQTLLIVAHGLAMILAWAVLGNIGVFVSRYLKPLGHRWYLLHRHIMLGVVFLAVLGFALAFAKMQLDGGKHFALPTADDHYNFHNVFGLAIFIAMFVQVLLGFVSNRLFNADRSAVPWWPDRVHWWFGRLVLFCAFLNIYLGLWKLQGHILTAASVTFIIFKILTGTLHFVGGRALGAKASHQTHASVNYMGFGADASSPPIASSGHGTVNSGKDNFGADASTPLIGGGAGGAQTASRKAERWLVYLRIIALFLTLLAFTIIVFGWQKIGSPIYDAKPWNEF
jgi:hypothetical protein